MIDTLSEARLHGALAHYDLMMEQIGGCSNHGCIIRPIPKGCVGTNSICQCWRDPIKMQHFARAANALKTAVENELK